MKYIEDASFSYEEDIIRHLRAHNEQFVGGRESHQQFLYAFHHDQVVGMLKANLFWDWVSMGDVHYSDVSILSTLLNELVQTYKQRAVGIKHYALNPTLENDLCALGFDICGKTAFTSKTPSYTYLRSPMQTFEGSHEINVLTSDHAIPAYHDKFERNKANDEGLTSKVSFVALDHGKFIGGLTAIIDEDSMYISRLVVLSTHKGLGIGKALLALAEKQARNLRLENITTGTCSFQAKPFYEKFGFKVIFTKENDPKGYESYSLEYRL